MTNTASVFDAFLLSCFASLGTLFGGVLVLLLVKFLPSSATTKTDNLIGTLQAAAAGVMMFLTFLDLIPESVEQLGKFVTLLWFFCKRGRRLWETYIQ